MEQRMVEVAVAAWAIFLHFRSFFRWRVRYGEPMKPAQGSGIVWLGLSSS